MSRISNITNFFQDFGPVATYDLLRNKAARKSVYRIRVPDISRPIHFRPGTIDLTILRQILLLKECIVPLDFEPKTIIDGGAHVGYSSILFANTYPDARILSIEPESTNCAIFQLNAREYSQIDLLEGALWPHPGELHLYNKSGLHDGFRVSEGQLAGTPSVRAITMSEILGLIDDCDIDILKLDIEGAEKDLFQENTDVWLPRVKVLMVEFHDRHKPGCRQAVESALTGRIVHSRSSGEYQIYYLKQ